MDQFFKAAEQGNLDGIKAFIKQNIDVNILDKDGDTALILAASRGHLDVAKELIENKADINIANNDGYTALKWAVYNNHLNILKVLIDNNADIDQANTAGETALMLAAINGHLNVVKVLIENKADINITNNDGNTALIWAANYGNLDVVKELILNKVNIDQPNNSGDTALIWAAKGGHLDVVKVLIENKVNIDQPNMYGYTALIQAIRYRHLDIVKKLIENNADIDKVDNYGYTALIEAARYGDLDAVRVLLNSGSDLLLVHTQGKTEASVLNKLLSDVRARPSFDKLLLGNFEGLNSLAKLQLLRAFNFMQNNYDKFKEFYSEKYIKEVKASLEAFKPLEAFINELTDYGFIDFSTADSRHKLENSINHLKHILENKAKYESEGIIVNQAKIQEFQNKCKVVAGKKYHELIHNLENIGLKDIFNKYFEKGIENGHVDLPDSICAQIYLKLLISNREAKENLSTNEDKVTENLPCATDMIYETYLLTSNIEKLGSILELPE